MTPDEVVGVGISSDETVFWRKGEPFCPKCEAPLGEEESVTFTERYAASVTETSFGVAIARSHVDFSTEACCAQCGQLLDYDDVVS